MLFAQAVLDVYPATVRSGGGGSAGIPGALPKGTGSDTRKAVEAAKPALRAISDIGKKVAMGSSTRIIRAALLVAAAALLAFAASQLREKHQEAEAVVENIHEQLDALDPATLWGSRTRPPVLTWASMRPAHTR